jgi:hypothetical protein
MNADKDEEMKPRLIETDNGNLYRRAARKLFCLKCERPVDLEKDIGAVELEHGAGVLCGDDVDKLIAEIWTPARNYYPGAALPPRREKDWWS